MDVSAFWIPDREGDVEDEGTISGSEAVTDELITPQDLNTELLRLSRQLDADHSNLIRMSSLWAHQESDYRMVKAREYLKSTGTVQRRQARVDLAAESERIKAHESEALLRAARLRMQATMSQLSALQSVANVTRSELKMAGRFD